MQGLLAETKKIVLLKPCFDPYKGRERGTDSIFFVNPKT